MPATAAGRSVTQHPPHSPPRRRRRRRHGRAHHRLVPPGARRRGDGDRPRGCGRRVVVGQRGLADAGHHDAAARAGRPQYGLRAVLSPTPRSTCRRAQPVVPQVRRRLHPSQHRRPLAAVDGRAGPDQRAGPRELRPAQGRRRPRRDRRDVVVPRGLPHRRRAPDAARGDRAHPRRRSGHRVRRAHRDEARAIEPVLSDEVGAAIRLRGQRFINPGAFVHALADAVIARGGKLATGPSSRGPRHRGCRPRRPRRDHRWRRGVRLRRPGHGCVDGQAGPPVRRAVGGPGRSRLQLLGPRRPRPRRSRLPARPARRLHAAGRPPARRGDDGVPLPRGASRRAPGPGHRGRRAPVPPGGRPRRP